MAKRLIYGRVHCHVCPMKDVCSVGDDRVSYDFFKNVDGGFERYYDQMQQITLNCPLKRLLFERVS